MGQAADDADRAEFRPWLGRAGEIAMTPPDPDDGDRRIERRFGSMEQHVAGMHQHLDAIRQEQASHSQLDAAQFKAITVGQNAIADSLAALQLQVDVLTALRNALTGGIVVLKYLFGAVGFAGLAAFLKFLLIKP